MKHIKIFELTEQTIKRKKNKFVTSIMNGDIISVKKIIKSGFDLNSKITDTDTPLIFAVEQNRVEMVQLLIDSGADVNYTDKKVFSGGYGSGSSNQGYTALICASALIHPERLKNNAWKPFVDRNHAIIKLLIDAGADLNIQTAIGWTALMYSADWGNIEVCKILIDAGANWYIQNRNGHDFIDLLNDKNREIIMNLYPMQYSELINVKKYNL